MIKSASMKDKKHKNLSKYTRLIGTSEYLLLESNFSVGLNFLDYEFKKLTFRPFLLVLNHICQSRIKVACKVAKSFLILFPVTLVKVEVQESSLHQMNCKKVYFLPCFMQNVQKLNMVGCRALNDRANHYGPPCSPRSCADLNWTSNLGK